MSIVIEDSNDSRPATPSDEDCCGNGCDYCVFEIHKKLLAEWQKRRITNVMLKTKKNLLSSTSYQTFVVDDVKKESDDHLLLCLKYEAEVKDDRRLFLKPGQHVVLSLGSISRPFTPISWTGNSLLLVIKLYLEGQFSKYLRNIHVGSKINVRGPYGEFEYKSNRFKQIIMFSVGSGIAALYPIAKAITNDENDETRINFIAGYQTLAQTPLKKELQNLSAFWNFICTIFLSNQSNSDVELHGINLKYGRLDKKDVCNILESYNPEATQVLICGTPQFNQSIEEWTKELSYIHIHVFK